MPETIAFGPVCCPVCGAPALDVTREGSRLLFTFGRAAERQTVAYDLAPLIEGVMRRKLAELCAELGLPFDEGPGSAAGH